MEVLYFFSVTSSLRTQSQSRERKKESRSLEVIATHLPFTNQARALCLRIRDTLPWDDTGRDLTGTGFEPGITDVGGERANHCATDSSSR